MPRPAGGDRLAWWAICDQGAAGDVARARVTTRGRRAPRTTRAALSTLAAAIALSVPATAALAGAARPAGAAGAAPTVYQNPLTAADAPDPDVLAQGGTYYAFTTGGVNGHIQEFWSTDLVNWSAVPPPGALTQEPGWVNPGLEWAPTVTEIGGRWVMLYATFDEWLDAECVTEAVAPAVTGPYVNDAGGPLVCQPLLGGGGLYYGGDIDPDVFFDADGTPYLLWKANPGGFESQAVIWSEQLAPDGLSLAPGSQQHALIASDQGWESTVENPDLVLANGTYYLFYSGGNWMDATYGVGYAVCDGPSGPCAKPTDRPILASAGPVVGPGGQWAFQDAAGQWWMAYAAWTAGNVGYPFGARSLRMDPLCFANGGQGGPAAPVIPGPSTTLQPLAQACPTFDTDAAYRLVAGDGGLFAYGQAPFYGSTVGQPVGPIEGMATDQATGGYWEVGADGAVHGFGAPPFGGLRGPLRAPIVGMAATPDGGGYWLVGADGGVFAYGAAAFFGSAGSLSLVSPIVGMAVSPDGGGYWLVAADGGVFAYGDAAFWGSMGGRPLDQPIAGMAAMPDGGGYWLVAADGGIFAFGDAPFRGSTGGTLLNRAVVGMAVDGDGGGYWLVAADGGIFAFGSAPFDGSTGSMVLNKPIVGMAAS